MSKKDLDDSDVGIIAQDVYSLDLGYGAVPPDYNNISYSGYGTDTITIDSSTLNSVNTITLPTTTMSNGNFTIGSAGSVYTTGTSGYAYPNSNSFPAPTVHINTDGIEMAAGTDLKIDGKSLKDFMSKMEQRLAILVPDPAKLEKFQALQKAYDHYKTMESLCFDEPKEEN